MVDPPVQHQRGALPRHGIANPHRDDSSSEEEADFENPAENYNRHNGIHEYKLKMDIPTFDGRIDIEDIFDWIQNTEYFFEYMNIPERKRVSLVAYKLKAGVAVWWEQCQFNRRRQGKQPIRTWYKMKQCLRARFLPPDYEHQLYQKYQNCHQASRSVTEYVEEFYRLSARNNLQESEIQLVSRFLSGLRESIRDELMLHTIWNLTEAVNLALKVETKLAKQSTKNQYQRRAYTENITTKSYSSMSSPQAIQTQNPTRFQKPMENVYPNTNSTKLPVKTTQAHPPNQQPPNPYARPMTSKCFRCNQPGHRSNECPQRRMVNMAAEISEQCEECDEFMENEDGECEDVVLVADSGEYVNCVIQKVLLTPSQPVSSQRNSLFRTRCTINKRVCDVIIDSGSCENIISKSLVKTLELLTVKHPHPYKIGWIKKGTELMVTEVCKVQFSIGKFYQDEIVCDVVDMHACHLLLGRPW